MADERRLWSALRGAARRVRGEVAPAVGLAMRDTRAALSYASNVAALRRDLGPVAADGYADVLRRLSEEDVDASRRVAQVLHQQLYRVGAEQRPAYLQLVALPLGRAPAAVPLVVEVAADLLDALDFEGARGFVERGLGVWADSTEKGESFLRRRSFEGIAGAKAVRGGALLADLRVVLTLYARAHLGRNIGIRSLPEGTAPFADRDGLWLPERVATFGDGRDFLVYRVNTALCTGYLEFGTLDLDLDRVPGAWPDRLEGEPEIDRLARGTVLPPLGRDLFQVLEDRRIEGRVRAEYPGVARDIDALRGMRTRRARASRLPLAAQLVEALAREAWHLAPADDLDRRVVATLSGMAERVAAITGPNATVNDVAAAVPELVVEALALQRAPKPPPQTPPEQRPTNDVDAARRSLSELAASMSQRPEPAEPPPLDPSSWPDLDLPIGNARVGGTGEGGPAEAGQGGGVEVVSEVEDQEDLAGEKRKVRPDVASFGPMRGHPSLYPEWDWRIDDHKARWTRVYEHEVPMLGTPFVQQTRLRHRALIQRLRHSFEALKPEDMRRQRHLVHGDELDMDAVIDARMVARAGGTPPERLYTRRERAVRDVAVAFLIDLSSSTSEMIAPINRRIVDLGREALVVISEAVDAIGDPYGIFGFSGYGREHVAVWVAKDFDEVLTDRVRDRIGGLVPRMENRDGAAIRHLTRRLMERPARVRLLMIISDGRPLDCGCTSYFERYAQEDTRMAVLRARDAGVHPFCITVDPRGSDYVEHMYGKGGYTVIDHVDRLPARLPALYRRLTR